MNRMCEILAPIFIVIVIFIVIYTSGKYGMLDATLVSIGYILMLVVGFCFGLECIQEQGGKNEK